MDDLILSSSLTDEEIADNFKSVDVFSGIMSGLEEALAYEKLMFLIHKNPELIDQLQN